MTHQNSPSRDLVRENIPIIGHLPIYIFMIVCAHDIDDETMIRS